MIPCFKTNIEPTLINLVQKRTRTENISKNKVKIMKHKYPVIITW